MLGVLTGWGCLQSEASLQNCHVATHVQAMCAVSYAECKRSICGAAPLLFPIVQWLLLCCTYNTIVADAI